MWQGFKRDAVGQNPPPAILAVETQHRAGQGEAMRWIWVTGLVLGLAGGATAQPESGVRPEIRPDYMVRHPVEVASRAPDIRPVARSAYQPQARWDFKAAGRLWTRAAMAAIAGHGAELVDIVPRDIGQWCPAYAEGAGWQRQAFWVGMMSALSKHESTYNPRAVGGGDLWYGLLQIYPDTARRYGCRARSGEALKNPAENLSCAVRIMAVTVARDRAVALHDGRWRGVAADWGPMQNARKISEMSSWTRRQSYCSPLDRQRPVIRPAVSPARSEVRPVAD